MWLLDSLVSWIVSVNIMLTRQITPKMMHIFGVMYTAFFYVEKCTGSLSSYTRLLVLFY